MTPRIRRRPQLANIRCLKDVRRTIRGGRGLTERVEWLIAETTDRVWRMERGELPRSGWSLYHQPSEADGSHPGPVMTCPTLKACQEAVASGEADRQLTQRKETEETD